MKENICIRFCCYDCDLCGLISCQYHVFFKLAFLSVAKKINERKASTNVQSGNAFMIAFYIAMMDHHAVCLFSSL